RAGVRRGSVGMLDRRRHGPPGAPGTTPAAPGPGAPMPPHHDGDTTAMPTYEYRCKDCGHEFEAVQSFTDDAISVCPTCGGTVKKRFGNVGISFKGSGFYKTDTRSSSSSGRRAAG